MGTTLEDIWKMLKHIQSRFDYELEAIKERLERLERQMERLERRMEKLGRQMERLEWRIEKLERQIELQKLTFRFLVKAAKASQEVEEELTGTYVRSGRGFNTKAVKYVRDPLA